MNELAFITGYYRDIINTSRNQSFMISHDQTFWLVVKKTANARSYARCHYYSFHEFYPSLN